MDYIIIAGFALIIIFSYLFDALARKTKFPAVILLIFLGLFLKMVAIYYDFNSLDRELDELIKVLGKVGLILIVLEGALELDINRSKFDIIRKSFISALFTLLICAFSIACVLHYGLDVRFEIALYESIPLSIISSAVAIPSAASLLGKAKEFVVYESTFSDILGIIIFSFVSGAIAPESDGFTFGAFLYLGFEVVIVFIVAIIVTFLLLELIGRIEHHVKFFLIMAILMLAYVIASRFHLSALIIVFVFGLVMSNSDFMLPKFLKKRIAANQAEKELEQFHLLTAETTFFVRTFFFLTFGYLINPEMFLNVYNYLNGGIILAVILVTRLLYFLIADRKNTFPIAFIAPRGLITILLFLQIPESYQNIIVNEKVLLIVILGTLFIMLIGVLNFSKGKQKS
ncbi:MAG: cation:proton antiporter [Flavobacteriaceae bacterium]